uniref:Uncharacterized protein n=1 Tax=uncultured prokaryote TaxID=198431 RepID=A0A0H5Q3U0_9ZZZZ|nr:hypothetical protein [uncultured prokaryote]
MPIPEDMMRAQLTFNLSNGSSPVDVAVTGFYGHRHHTATVSTDWPADIQRAAEGIRDRWTEHMPRENFGNAVQGMVVKTYHLDTSGHTLDEGIAPWTNEDGWNGNGDDTMPWETSLVVTTYGYPTDSFVAQRARKRGRMYLPPLALTAVDGPEGKLSTAAQNVLSLAIAAFFNDVQGMHIADSGSGLDHDYWDMAILSKAGGSYSQMIEYSIGNVFDVQRRRRNNQTESRVYGDIEHSD